MLSALIKYYKENTSLLKRFWSRFMYDDLQYIHQNIIDDLFESTKSDFGFVDDTPKLNGITFKATEWDVNVYTVKDFGDKDTVEIHWVMDGLPNSTTYKREEVMKLFRAGEWIQID
jgi:hypothetical protein